MPRIAAIMGGSSYGRSLKAMQLAATMAMTTGTSVIQHTKDGAKLVEPGKFWIDEEQSIPNVGTVGHIDHSTGLSFRNEVKPLVTAIRLANQYALKHKTR